VHFILQQPHIKLRQHDDARHATSEVLRIVAVPSIDVCKSSTLLATMLKQVSVVETFSRRLSSLSDFEHAEIKANSELLVKFADSQAAFTGNHTQLQCLPAVSSLS
jgi:aspartate oxidase